MSVYVELGVMVLGIILTLVTEENMNKVLELILADIIGHGMYIAMIYYYFIRRSK